MTLHKRTVVIGVACLLGGIGIAWGVAAYAVNSDNHSLMKMMGLQSHQEVKSGNHMDMSMNQMTAELQERTGDDFDKNFVAMMIAHHQGAIHMARSAEVQGKHDELKQLATQIIEAQTHEIERMQQWEIDWGYGSENTHGSHRY